MSSSILKTPKLKISLLAGSVSLIGGFLYLMYKNHNSHQQKEFDFPRDTVLTILREFRREFYTLFKSISAHSKKFQEEIKAKNPQISQSELHQLLVNYYLKEESGFTEETRNIENRIYVKYDIINQAEFERFYHNMAKEDMQIREMRDEIIELCRLAVIGKLSFPKIVIPENIDSTKVLNGIAKVEKGILQKMTTFLVNFKRRKGTIDFNSLEFKNEFSMLDIDFEKNKLAKEMGFDFVEDYHPYQLLIFCSEKLQNGDRAFKEKVTAIEEFKTEFLKNLFVSEMNDIQYETEIDKLDQIVNSENMTNLAEPNLQSNSSKVTEDGLKENDEILAEDK